MRRVELGVWAGGLAAAATAAVLVDAPGGSMDLPYFVGGAHTLFSTGWLTTYADPGLQAGPLQLGLIGAGDRLAGLVGASSTTVLAVLLALASVALLLAAARALLGGHPRVTAALAVVAAAALGTGLLHGSFFYGHPAQVVVPALWVLAGVAARRGSAVAAGALIGLSAGFEVWGVLGVPALLLAPRRRAALGGLGALSVTVAVLFGPFVVHGPFRMFDYRWDVSGGTLVGLIVAPGTGFTWPLRLVQGACAVLAGATAATVLRRSRAAVWAAPLAVVAVRLALDPTRNGWYMLAFQALALLGAVELLTSEPGHALAARLRREPRAAGPRDSAYVSRSQ